MLCGGAEGDRTPDLRIANAALCQTELLPHLPEHIRKPMREVSNQSTKKQKHFRFVIFHFSFSQCRTKENIQGCVQ